MLRVRLIALFVLALLVSACSTPAVRTGFRRGAYAPVIGSIVVELERTPRSGWDGFFEEDLELRAPDYVFHFGSARGPWNRPPERVRVRGSEPVQFVLPLAPGPASIDDLELVVYRGPSAWALGLISTTDGTRLPIDLEFSVDPGRITYIGRIRVVLPSKLQLFSSRARVTVEDAAGEDFVSLNTLIENTPLPVETVLARQGESR